MLMYFFFFTFKIVWIQKTSTTFKIAACRSWIMLSRPHFAHMPQSSCVFPPGCLCLREPTQGPATGRRPRWPPPGWAVKLGEDVFEPDVKRRTQQRRFKEEKQRWEEMAKNGERKRELPAGQRVQMNQRRVKMERICGREVWILSQWGFHGNLPTSSFF